MPGYQAIRENRENMENYKKKSMQGKLREFHKRDKKV
jgi:hypothetical protein